MQVNKPVIDNNYMVLVPTRVTDKTIRATDRLMKHGLLGIADSVSLNRVLENAQTRLHLIKKAIGSTYTKETIAKLIADKALMDELDLVLQDVFLYAKCATYNCHHQKPHPNMNGCLRPYYPNTN